MYRYLLAKSEYRLTPDDIDAMTFAQVALYSNEEEEQGLSVSEVASHVTGFWERRAEAEGKTVAQVKAEAASLVTNEPEEWERRCIHPKRL